MFQPIASRLKESFRTKTRPVKRKRHSEKNASFDFRRSIKHEAGIEEGLTSVLGQVVHNRRFSALGQVLMRAAELLQGFAIRSSQEFAMHLKKEGMGFRGCSGES